MKYSGKRAELLNITRSLLATLTRSTIETNLLQTGIEALARLIEVKYGAIGLLDEQGKLIHFAHTGMKPEEVQRIGRQPEGKGLLGVVIRGNAVLRLDDLAADPRSAGFPPHHPPMKTLLAVPVSSQGRVYGRVYLCDRLDGAPFSDEDEELTVSFASALSLVLDNARKIEELGKSQNLAAALHDVLTGLPNLALLYERANQILSHANRSKHQVAVMFCGLDGFRTVNESFGHEAGDHILKTMAKRFLGSVREEDTVARVGGDEFVLMLPDIDSVIHIELVAQKILDAISGPIAIGEQIVTLSGSIGIAVYPNDGETTESMVKNADIAMYKAKEFGRNNYQFFSEALISDKTGRLELFGYSRYI
jgi:diguanylate cyclase (GGDEF)-like protein